MWKAAIGAGLMAAGLAACDATDEDAFDDFEERAELNEALVDRVEDLPVATAAEVPVTGGATYEGYAGIVMGDEGDTALLGDATLSADFEEDTIAGRMDNFVGEVEDGDAEEFEGQIVLDDGRIGVGSASGILADMEGRLTGEEGDDVIAIDGSLEGDLRSDNDGVTAVLGLSGPTTDFILNGEEVGGLMSVVAD